MISVCRIMQIGSLQNWLYSSSENHGIMALCRQTIQGWNDGNSRYFLKTPKTVTRRSPRRIYIRYIPTDIEDANNIYTSKMYWGKQQITTATEQEVFTPR